jgi:acetyl coenzyme A synthetase (ADP forming)-like protein
MSITSEPSDTTTSSTDEPGGGPDGVDVLLADGTTAQIRSITPEDAPAVSAFHRGLSGNTVHMRYFGGHPNLSDRELERLTRADDPDHLVLLAERNGTLVAVAQYEREVGKDEAEVAFVVDDAHQGLGLGTILLEHLASAARRHGIKRFAADTLVVNRRMLDVFAGVGFARRSSTDHEVVNVVMDIAPTQQALDAADRRDAVAVVRSMERLLRPRSVAVIGASRQAGTIGYELVRNLVGTSLQGPVYPVNPMADHVASIPCWPSIEAVPGEVDLAVIAVPAASVTEAVESCGRKGVAAVVVVSAGFAEVGPEGEAAQRAAARLAHDHSMRMVGPNCFGVLNTAPAVSMNATFAADVPIAGRVGFASQSGGLGIAILAEAKSRDLGLSSFVSLGNKADISGNDLLTWWEQDDDTEVILLYLESFGNARKFARLARRIGRTKPIVVVKSGRSRAGRRAASSHTAALASPEQAVDALFLKAGVLRVDTVEELFDTAETLVHQPLPSGRRVAILTNSGGPGVLATDASSGNGLVVAELSPATQAALWAITPTAGGVANPVDLGASAGAESYGRSLDVLLADDDVDAVVVVFTPPLVTATDDVARAIVRAADAADINRPRPIVASLLGTSSGRDILRSARRPIPCFTYPETAIRALAHAADYATWRSKSRGTVPELDGIRAGEARRRTIGVADEHGWITGAPALEVLAAHGIPVQPTEAVADAEEAGRAAQRLGFPVAIKAVGPSIVHKSDIGGVHLGLTSSADVSAAYRSMQNAIGPEMTGVVLQPMAEPGVETLVGFVQDRAFGPQVLFGMGGVAVELLEDHVMRLAPLTDVDAREMVLGLKGSPLLTGYRGSVPVDVDALVDLLLRVGLLAEDFPEIEEMDANPVIATSDGVVVVDARLRLSSEPPPPPDDTRHLG